MSIWTKYTPRVYWEMILKSKLEPAKINSLFSSLKAKIDPAKIPIK